MTTNDGELLFRIMRNPRHDIVSEELAKKLLELVAAKGRRIMRVIIREQLGKARAIGSRWREVHAGHL